jgi:hypothetical protein
MNFVQNGKESGKIMIFKVSEEPDISTAVEIRTNSRWRAVLIYRNQCVNQNPHCSKYYAWTPTGLMGIYDRRGHVWEEPDFEIIS